MESREIVPFALGERNKGYLNQILGAFKALADLTGQQYDSDRLFMLPENVSNVGDMKDAFFYSQFESYEAFRRKIFEMADAYFQKTNFIPKVFITVYNPTESRNAAEDSDMLCRAVKEYYKEHNLGNIFTAILTSRLHRYKYADMINVPKHLMTFRSRLRLLQHKGLRKRILITIGTINNFDQKTVNEKYRQLLKTIAKDDDNAVVQGQLEKLRKFKAADKKVVLCLGGRVEGTEIVFGLKYAQNLLNDAERLSRCGYGVVFVNGPRTPNDVTDFLYEKTRSNPNITFQNSKKIAADEEERSPKNWRIYSGKYEDDFRALQKIGNIYPGILGFGNTLAVHTMDSYSGCETANAAIRTAISGRGLDIDPVARYDCYNLQKLLCPKYAVDWDDFVKMACNLRIEPKNLTLQVLSSPLRIFAETVLNRLNNARRPHKRQSSAD